MKKYILAITFVFALGVQAQEVSTLYFLENAPMRHLVNPAFQPVSKGYVNFSPLGYSSSWVGNNAYTLTDFVYAAPDGSTVTVLHPEYGRKDAFLKSLPKSIHMQQDATINWLGFGFRLRENGYITVQAMTRIDSKEAVSTALFPFLLNGEAVSTTSTVGLNLGQSRLATQIYTEVGGGYSHKINDMWTVGGKFKFLIGTAYLGTSFSQMDLTGNTQALRLQAQGNLQVAGPINYEALPSELSYEDLSSIDYEELLWMDEQSSSNILSKITKPSGYGAAVDLGFTVTPLKQLQVNVSLNDLGFINWTNASQFNLSADTTFMGVGPLNFDDYMVDGQFMADSLTSDILTQVEGLANAIKIDNPKNRFCRMITTKLNIGVDGHFFDNRLSVGLLSKTMLYKGHVNEELTLGVAGKPVKWCNIALSYSLLNNGKFSNIGAGLSIMPYDGINLTLAADYIPTYYASVADLAFLPSRSKGLNVAMGLSIVWGTNPKKDKKAPTSELEMVEPKENL